MNINEKLTPIRWTRDSRTGWHHSAPELYTSIKAFSIERSGRPQLGAWALWVNFDGVGNPRNLCAYFPSIQAAKYAAHAIFRGQK